MKKRKLALKKKGNGNNILIIQIYAPKDDSDIELGKFYEESNTSITENKKFTDTLEEWAICKRIMYVDHLDLEKQKLIMVKKKKSIDLCRKNKFVAYVWF